MLVREANEEIWQMGDDAAERRQSAAAATCLRCSSDTGRTYNKVWRQSNNSGEAPAPSEEASTARITYN